MKRLWQLDVVRVAATLIVYVHHFLSSFFPTVIVGQAVLQHGNWEKWVYATPLGLIANGNFAVHIFIALSGFALYYSFFQNQNKKITIDTYVQRYLRLAVPVLASVLLGYWLSTVHKGLLPYVTDIAPWLSQWWKVVPNLVHAIVQGAVAVMFVNDSAYNPVLWMLHYLWISSAIFFTFILFFQKSPWRRWVNALLVVIFFHTAYLVFWLGVGVADLYTSKLLPRLPSYLKYLGWILVLLLGSFPSYNGELDVFYKYLILPGSGWGISGFYHGLAAALLLLLVLSQDALEGSRATALLTTASNVSFSFFLIHFPIIGSFALWLFIKLRPIYGYNSAAWIGFVTTTILLVPLSYIFYLFFDRITQRSVKRIHLHLPKFK